MLVWIQSNVGPMIGLQIVCVPIVLVEGQVVVLPIDQNFESKFQNDVFHQLLLIVFDDEVLPMVDCLEEKL